MSLKKIKEGFKTYVEKQRATQEERKIRQLKLDKRKNLMLDLKAQQAEAELKTLKRQEQSREKIRALQKYKQKSNKAAFNIGGFSSGMGDLVSPSGNIFNTSPPKKKKKRKSNSIFGDL